MFRWNITELTQSADTYVLTANGDVWINELVFVDAEGNALPVVSASVVTGGAADAEAAVPLFDEQALKPEYPNPQNGMYFDELYHARTALEHLKGLTPYENSHPPLGKILIMAGIALFGMTPFGWRFSGALFGVLMLPVLYALCRRAAPKSKWAFLPQRFLPRLYGTYPNPHCHHRRFCGAVHSAAVLLHAALHPAQFLPRRPEEHPLAARR